MCVGTQRYTKKNSGGQHRLESEEGSSGNSLSAAECLPGEGCQVVQRWPLPLLLCLV